MRRSADAATLMQQSFDISDLTLLFPQQIIWDEWIKYHPDIVFSEEVMDFLGALSASLLNDRESRIYPDVITFAFFCRKANLLRLKTQYVDESLRLGRGIVFHIAPSNVPVNFGYSLVAGLLAVVAGCGWAASCARSNVRLAPSARHTVTRAIFDKRDM